MALAASQQPQGYYGQPVAGNPYYGQQPMGQPLMGQPMMQQPMGTQPMVQPMQQMQYGVQPMGMAAPPPYSAAQGEGLSAAQDLEASQAPELAEGQTTQWNEPPPVYEGYDASVWANPQQYQTDPSIIPSAPQIEGGSSSGDGCCEGCQRSMSNSPTIFALNILFPILLIIGVAFIGVGPLSTVGLVGLIIGSLCYIIYICRACNGGDAQYLSNKCTVTETYNYMQEMKQAPPIFWYHIECYHYRTTGSGKNKKRKKVVTHRATGEFAYSTWMDVSPANPDFSSFELTKTKFELNGLFGDQFTQQVYEAAKAHFYHSNSRDQHQTKTSGVKLNGWKPKMVVNLDGTEVPWWIGKEFMMCVTCFGCASCYKCMFEGRSGRLGYKFEKRIFCIANATPQVVQQGWQPQAQQQPVMFMPTTVASAPPQQY